LNREDLLNSDAYNITFTIEELIKLYPNINWKLYFNERLNKKNNIKNAKISVGNITPKYFEVLNKILVETDIDTIIYYAEW